MSWQTYIRSIAPFWRKKIVKSLSSIEPAILLISSFCWFLTFSCLNVMLLLSRQNGRFLKNQPANQIKMYWWPEVSGFVLGYHHSTWWDQSPNAFIVHQTKTRYYHLDVSIYCCVGWSLFKQMTQTNILAPIKSWIINMEKSMLVFDPVAAQVKVKFYDLTQWWGM